MSSFARPTRLRQIAYSAAFLITALEARLVVQALEPIRELASLEGSRIVSGRAALFCGMPLVWITFLPLQLTPSHTGSPEKTESVINSVTGDKRWVADGPRPLL